MQRQIVHVDIASFAVAVERVVHPELRSRPVAVAALGTPRAVVTVVSPEAWSAGIRSGMVVGKALRCCRDLKVVPPDERLYGRATRAVCAILQEYTPLMEAAGPGHAYLDLTGTNRLLGAARETAWRVQREIRERLRLDSAVGLAGNKLVSRIASLVRRPTGLEDVEQGEEADFLAPLPARVLPGIGPPLRVLLSELNLSTVGEIARMKPEHLAAAFGRFGFVLHRQALGLDNTPVRPARQMPVVVSETALREDSNDVGILRLVLIERCEDACAQLRNGGWRAGTLALRLQYSDRREASSTVRFSPASDSPARARRAALLLFERMTRRTRVRKVILNLSGLVRGPAQLELFPDPQPGREARLNQAVDLLRRRFGNPAVRVCTAPDAA